MLINVFSLHRTGSTWFSHYIKNQYPGSLILNEIFNQLAYFTTDENDVFTPHEEYFEGCFFRAPNRECTKVERYFRKFIKEDECRFDRWIQYIKNSPLQHICHTHLSPLQDEKYLCELSLIADKNYYIYRENILEQIASKQIMDYTGEYKVTIPEKANRSDRFIESIVHPYAALHFYEQIMNADDLVDGYISSNVEKLSYESLPFEKTINGMPLKQNISAFERLCDSDQEILRNMVNQKN